MSLFWTLTFILPALLKSGYSLSCKHCFNNTGNYCSGPELPCDSKEEVCVSSYTKTSVGGMEISNIFLQQCDNRALCAQSASISFPDGRERTSYTCCLKDGCTPPVPTFPVDKTEENGVSCVSCIAVNDKMCTSKELMKCIGNENKCITQATFISEPVSSTTVVRGCATPNSCVGDTTEKVVGTLRTKIDISCTDGSISPHYNLLLLIFSILNFFLN
ncbi:phospholipase A2 inhibitor and Ly6/PLAUR domain-containing protein [Bombina bombina]|uniref:phospholipase A2 inhibitor and Ly6/PLAUR domain-containing protein n=1 Tax=Bombina bombina TaxID=8345 RepID=UPI00235ADBDF|nr:phospholipase A2 inhibitor and Ly6/PLAUR domain-containing protein [Bombina bombina]